MITDVVITLNLLLKDGSAKRAPASDTLLMKWSKSAEAESLPRVMVQVGWAESPPRVIRLLKNNTLPEFWVCLSEWATCLSALTATRELWFMGPSASSVLIES